MIDLANIIDKTFLVLSIAIILRALLSWFPNMNRGNPMVDFLITVTEPILAPIRSVMPRGVMLDLSPMIAIILLQVIRSILLRNI